MFFRSSVKIRFFELSSATNSCIFSLKLSTLEICNLIRSLVVRKFSMPKASAEYKVLVKRAKI